MAQQIKIRRDTAANWTSVDPILAQGEPALETDTAKQKIGDGTTAWTSLPYIGALGGDMTLAGVETVTGAKTFEALTLLLRNVANTFSSWFTNVNTAARTYTLPDKDGTVAMTSDIGSMQTFTFGVGATTWDSNHGLNTLTPLITVFDENDEVAIPLTVEPIDVDNTRVTWSTARTGKVSIGGDFVGVATTQPQRIITLTEVSTVADNTYLLIFNSGTPINFTFAHYGSTGVQIDFYNKGAGTVTFLAGTATLDTSDGTALAQGKVASMFQITNGNDYILKGELV